VTDKFRPSNFDAWIPTPGFRRPRNFTFGTDQLCREPAGWIAPPTIATSEPNLRDIDVRTLLARTARFLALNRRYDGLERAADTDWRYLTSWVGEPCEIAAGWDISKTPWHAAIDPATGMQRTIEGVDGVYGDTHHVHAWCIEQNGEVRTFAADELSNGIWIVFVSGTA
jgi:hypothetical protein